jgi:hypothetical protein
LIQAFLMAARILALILLPALLLPAANKKSIASSRGENEDLVITATLHLDPADIKEMIGDDLGGHYIVAEVKIEPKFGKDIAVDRDDFTLRTDKDGEKATPYAGSQIAGRGALIIGQESRNEGIASPGWTGVKVPVVKNGGTPKAKPAEGDKPAPQQPAAKEEPADNPLKKALDAKILPEGKTTEPVSGLLYFPLEKQRMKDLELVYGGRENRIRLRFKPQS